MSQAEDFMNHPIIVDKEISIGEVISKLLK